MGYNLRLAEVRKAAKVTQEELAKRLGINRATLSKYENGTINLNLSQLQKIADALGCSKWDLVETTTPEEMYYRKDIEKHSNMVPVGFPDDPFRQHAVNRISLAISNVDEAGVQAIVDHAEFIEQKYTESQKKDSEK